MKRISALFLISAILFLGGCSLGKAPKFSVLPKCIGTVIFDENDFESEVDFTSGSKKVIIKNKENAFNTVYTFSGDKVKLKYDEIETTLEVSSLPDTNCAALIYKIVSELESGNVSWEKAGNIYHFSSKINEVSFSGECDENGKIISFEVPEYKFYFKSKKLV